MGEKYFLPIIFGIILILASCSSSTSGEQSEEAVNSYPEKSIELIVPWDAGGETDAIYRLLAERLSEELDQNVVIKNIAGGSGVVGAQEALTATPDGYTLLAVHDSVVLSELTGQADFGFDDFELISLLTSTYEMVAAPPNSSWENVNDFIEEAKDRPNEISYAASIGSTTQLLPAMIQTDADIELNIVGYDGTAERMKAIAGEDVDLSSVSVTAGKEYFEDERMKLLGYTGEERSEHLPEVPTLVEQGVDVNVSTNRGLVAPKDTPESIINKLNDTLKKIVDNEDFKKEIEEMGSEVNFEETDSYIKFIEENEELMKNSLEESGLLD